MSAYEHIRLHIPEEVERLMESRLILKENMQQTIDHAEATGEKFINPSTGRSLASFRPGRVTYWVEYTRVGDDYQVHATYSHRMEMKRRGYD
jgi:hypothetical protein